MLKTFSVAILAIAMSVGVAQAKGHMHKQMMMSACIDGQQASATCACGTTACRHVPRSDTIALSGTQLAEHRGLLPKARPSEPLGGLFCCKLVRSVPYKGTIGIYG